MSERVSVYVDGFNLYYGLCAKRWSRKFKWLDVGKLAENLLLPHQTLVGAHYFTARISGPPKRVKRQTTYLDALETLDTCTIHYGHFLANWRVCSNCGHRHLVPEEKMTDVNIAVEVLSDAAQNRFDTAILVSGDSDMAPIVERVLQAPLSKRVVVAFPPERVSKKLKGLAPCYTINRKHLVSSQLPASVIMAAGISLEKPAEWK